MRKVKLGYVDISVAENWKIVQDHTRGKKLTSSPAVGLYGANKNAPHWHNGKATAPVLHTWASSYADHYGYGHWDPDCYDGASVQPHGKNYHYGDQKGTYHPPKGMSYGHGGEPYSRGPRDAYCTDSKRHEGALKSAGVALGAGGKGYMSKGRWHKGDQVTQMKTDSMGMIARRRTVMRGGKLSGAAHSAYKGAKIKDYKRGSFTDEQLAA